MSQQHNMLLTGSSMRLFKDKAARFGVTLGGALVLIALLLIFFYLLYVVQPIFKSVHIETSTEFSLTTESKTLALGVEEQNEIGFRYLASGDIEFFRVKATSDSQKIGDVISKEQLLANATVASFAASAPQTNTYAYGLEDGRILVSKPRFMVSFPNDVRVIAPSVTFPTGKETILIDPKERSLSTLAMAVDSEQYTFAAVTADGELIASALLGEENFLTGDIEWVAQSIDLPDAPTDITSIEITPDHATLFASKGNQIWVFDIRYPDEVTLSDVIQANSEGSDITEIRLLSGASSLLVGSSDGDVSQWFQVPTEDGRVFQKIRQFQTSNASVVGIYPEYYRRSFLTQREDGSVSLSFTTSNTELWQGELSNKPIDNLAFSPRSNSVILNSGSNFKLVHVENEHPEVTWSALWQEVWYEGYPEPKYVWQSTSASDDFEGKFSLVPISFGTLKAAAYAMLFAIPIGLASAIYTAYFMSAGLRKYVKPTIEIMEALPTVILGFLAGLWLAPLIEDNLPGMVLLLVMLPITILLVGYGFHVLPKKYKRWLPEGWDAIVLLPAVLLVGYLSFAMSPVVELAYFGGDMRRYITNELGINFDQRNSMVVGIAMGFAVIPTIFSIAEDAVFSVPKQLSNGSLALGATQWQTLVGVVLLTASPGIFSAVMMGLGRAVGETMIVLMATGNTPIMDWSIFQGMRTLAANIAVEMPESEVGSSHYRILFLAAFVLFIFTFVFNTIAEVVRQRLRERYSSL